MEFITKTEVFDKRYNKILRIIIGIICLFSIFAVILVLFIERKFDFGFIYGLSILIPYFFSMREKQYISDVRTNITEFPTTFNIEMSNIVIERKKTFNRLYIIEKENLNIETYEEYGKIRIVGNGIVKIIDCNDECVYEESFKNQIIELNVNNETFKDLIQYLNNHK